jgi:hypothetical protein
MPNNRDARGLTRKGAAYSLAIMFSGTACARPQNVVHSRESLEQGPSVVATSVVSPAESYDPPMIDPHSASLEALKEYTRDALGEGPTVSSRVISVSPEAYQSQLDGAPAVVPTHYWLYGFLAMVYERSCPEGHCYIDVNGPDVLTKFDYHRVSDDVRSLLQGAGHQLAFAGLSSGELYITSMPTPTGGPITRYYQVRFAARPCTGFLEWSDPCGMYGDASLIAFARQNGNATVSYSVDELCLRIEAAALNEVWRAIRRSSASRRPAQPRK